MVGVDGSDFGGWSMRHIGKPVGSAGGRCVLASLAGKTTACPAGFAGTAIGSAGLDVSLTGGLADTAAGLAASLTGGLAVIATGFAAAAVHEPHSSSESSFA